MFRRSFLGWMSFGWLVSWLAGCGNKQATQAAKRPDGFIVVGTLEELQQKGQLAIEQATLPVLVVRNSADAKTLVAVNPTCTHEGCIVQWKGERNAFACNCHGSNFAADGKVTAGPAKAPLPTYEVKVEGNSVLVKV